MKTHLDRDFALSRTCGHCGHVFHIMVCPFDYNQWLRNGKELDQAMPYLDRNQRNLLVGGVCVDCENLITCEVG